jgi:Ni/Co efflux regulator RcnB
MKTLFAAAVAVSLLTGAVATANADEGRDRGRHYDRGDRNDHRSDRGRDRDRDRRDFRGHERRDDRHDRDHRRDHDWRDHNRRRYDNDRHYRHFDRRDAYRAGYVRGRVDQHRFNRGRYVQPRGFYHHHWRHGDHLPRAYYSSRYVVHDYHAYHLSRPPYGYHWVRVNDDVILAAVASGLVVSVVNGLFY